MHDCRNSSERNLEGPPLILWPVFVLIGFTAVVAQIVLMRELIVICYGNEISLGLALANWLLWTALGSAILGRVAGKRRMTYRSVAALEIFVGSVFPLTIFLLRGGRQYFQPVTGELLGPGSMFLLSFVALSLTCLGSGGLFAAASRLYGEQKGESLARATGSVYWIEGIGSGVGGLVTGFVLISRFSPFTITLMVALLNFAAAFYLACWAESRLLTPLLALLACGVFFVPSAGRWLEKRSLSLLWKGLDLVETRTSVYGNLALVKAESSATVFENGLVLYNIPDPASDEEAVHYALLENPEPESLLLIGGGGGGALAEALQHRTLRRVDYVELDPSVIRLMRDRFPRVWTSVEKDPRVRVHLTDGRLFLKTTKASFDVIIVNLPDPQTAQINRFYTLEFFQEAARRLTAKGVFSFHLSGAENYISPSLARFLRCINKTLRLVFPQVTYLPGETIHFFAAKKPGILAADVDALLARLRSRGLNTKYVRNYYLRFRMSPDRMLDLQAAIQPQLHTPINTDLAPVAYYFDAALWATRFHPSAEGLFSLIANIRFRLLVAVTVALIFLFAFVLYRLTAPARRPRSAAGFSVAAMGFTLIGLEILILLGFQAIYGYVYHQLAVVIACFMLGIAFGGWFGLRKIRVMRTIPDLFYLSALQLAAAISGLVLYAIFDLCEGVQTNTGLFLVSNVLFPILALVCGALGGLQFPVASHIFFSETDKVNNLGAPYALDLAGAFSGALLFSTWLIPVFGLLRVAFLIAVVNLAPASLALFSALSSRRPRGLVR